MPCVLVPRSKQGLADPGNADRDVVGRCLQLADVLMDFMVDQLQQATNGLPPRLAQLLDEAQDEDHCSLREALQVCRGPCWRLCGNCIATELARGLIGPKTCAVCMLKECVTLCVAWTAAQALLQRGARLLVLCLVRQPVQSTVQGEGAASTLC